MADTVALINLKPWVDAVIIPIITALVPVLVTWVSIRAAALLKVREEETVRPRLQQALESALALMQAHGVKDDRVQVGVDYVMAQVPDTLKILDVTAKQVENKLTAEIEKIEQRPKPSATVDVTVLNKPPV